MLRDVVVHLYNEQPVLADLLFALAQTDTVVICRNLRAMNGTKPVFVDKGESTFVIPLAHVRFVEIHPSSIEASDTEEVEVARTTDAEFEERGAGPEVIRPLGGDAGTPQAEEPREIPAAFDDGGLDHDLIRRIREA
jgi:hypothetical protein